MVFAEVVRCWARNQLKNRVMFERILNFSEGRWWYGESLSTEKLKSFF